MPFHTRYSHWLQSPSRRRTKDNTQTHTQAIWSWDITPWVTYQSALELWNMNPEKEVIWWNQRKAPPPLPKALKFLTAFPNSFWQIVTTIQVEEKKNILKNQAEKRKSPHKSQVPSEQGRGMNLLQDTSVSEADAVEQREAHILHSRL